MFYRYEHYMSISHIALIVNMVHMQSGHKDGIWHIKLCHANNEKWEMTHDRRNRTAKPRKNQKVRRNWNLRILGNIGRGYHQTSRNERKKLKRVVSQENEKTTRNETMLQKSHQRDKRLGCPSCEILGSILGVDEGTREQENLWQCIRPYIPQALIEQKLLENKDGKKNNCMDISSDK